MGIFDSLDSDGTTPVFDDINACTGLKIMADYKYSYINGSDTAIVTGNHNRYELGLTTAINIGVKFDIAISNKTTMDISAWDYKLEHTFFGAHSTKATAIKNDIAAQKTKLAAEEIAIMQSSLLASTSNLSLITNSVNTVTNDVRLIANDIRSTAVRVTKTEADIKQKSVEMNDVNAKIETAGVILADHEASLESAGINIIDAGITMLG